MTISGQVWDLSSTPKPLANVVVADGTGKSIKTATDGSYKLEEDSLRTYNVTISRTGLTGYPVSNRAVSPTDSLQPVNFTMKYTVEGSVSPANFANAPGTVLTIAAKSYAPTDACFVWTGPSGATVALTLFNGVSGGQSEWRGSYTVPATLTDARYSTSIVGSECGSGPVLTTVAPAYFTIDTSPPKVVDMAPLDGGNIWATTTSVDAAIRDSLSGVKASSVTFVAEDLTDGTVRNLAGTGYDSWTGIVSSAKVAWTEGHRYRVTVNATDLVGNATSAVSNFLAVKYTIAADPTLDLLYDEPVNLGLDLEAGKNKWRFPSVILRVSDYPVTVSGTNHAGWGTIPTVIDLAESKIRYLVAGQGSPPHDPNAFAIPADSATNWHDTVAVGQQIALIGEASSFNNTTVRTSPVEMALGDLEVLLPPTAESPSITMDEVRSLELGPDTIPVPKPPPSPSRCITVEVGKFCTDKPLYGVSKDYLISYLSDDEANVLALNIKAGRDNTKCKQLPQSDPEWALCIAHQGTSLATGLLARPFVDAGVTRIGWTEASQYAFWASGLGKRPTTKEPMNSLATATSDSPGVEYEWEESYAGTCLTTWCSALAANEGYHLPIADFDASPTSSTESSSNSSNNNYVGEVKCTDNHPYSNNTYDPDRKACKQAGYIDVDDYLYKDQQQHYVYGGWYRTRGTADGFDESVALEWSGPDRNHYNFNQSNQIRYVAGIHSYFAEDEDGRPQCNKPTWRGDGQNWDNKVVWYNNVQEPVVQVKTRFQSGQVRGQGQAIDYLQQWRDGGHHCWTPYHEYISDVKWEYRTTIGAFSTKADASAVADRNGFVRTFVVHHQGGSPAELICSLASIKLKNPAAIILAEVVCSLPDGKGRMWWIDIAANQRV